MKKFLLSIFSLTFLPVTLFLLHSVPASAAPFNANNLIIDGKFNNSNSMNAAQIDALLNGFPNSCLSTNHGFSAPDPIGYSPSTGFRYGGDVSAGTIIYHAAQAYDLNPQVILVTLQKEQSLVTGTTMGCNSSDANVRAMAYTAAMGNDCPDSVTSHDYHGFELYSINGIAITDVTGTCVNDPKAAGFSQQVITATWKLKFWQQRSEGNVSWNIQKPGWDNSDDPPQCYFFKMTEGNFKRCSTDTQTTFFDGLYTIDGSVVHMDNGATAALYVYTPHFPGNQNFDSLFTDWFGSPILGCGSNETAMQQVVSMYNPRTYDHFYTAYRCEADILGFQQGYTYEGAAFNTTPVTVPGAVAVWRLYNPVSRLHLWTTSQQDINFAQTLGYSQEGIAFYTAAPSAPNVYAAVQRLYNPTTFQHFWTIYQSALNAATSQAGYQLEGVGFYSQ